LPAKARLGEPVQLRLLEARFSISIVQKEGFYRYFTR
jgi:hypothetical protein